MAANDNQRQRRMAVLPCAILTRAAAANTLESAAADLGFGRIFVSETGAPDYPLSKSDIKRLGSNTAQQCGSGSPPQTSRSHGASSASCARRAPTWRAPSWYCHVGPETAVFGRQALCTRANAPYKRKLIWCGECEGAGPPRVGPDRIEMDAGHDDAPRRCVAELDRGAGAHLVQPRAVESFSRRRQLVSVPYQ